MVIKVVIILYKTANIEYILSNWILLIKISDNIINIIDKTAIIMVENL